MARTQMLYHISGEDGRVVYAGKSVRPETRLKQHIYEARLSEQMTRGRGGPTNAFHRWLLRELAAARMPTLTVIRALDAADWRADERRAIRDLAEAGEPILNSHGNAKTRSGPAHPIFSIACVDAATSASA